MAKGGKKMTGGSCSAHAHGQQVYGGINEQHAAPNGGNVIAMNAAPVTGGKKRSKKSAKKSRKSKSAKKSRRNRSSRRR